MGKLENALVERLLQTSNSHKQNAMEQRIRQLLGAQPFTEVTGLPPRRGKADGGIDGVLQVACQLDQDWQETRAALNLKVRKTAFSRGDLGAFVLDMERERIWVGIIITAAGLAPDALAELGRKNGDGAIKLVHFQLADILAGNLADTGLLLGVQTLGTVLQQNLAAILVDEGGF